MTTFVAAALIGVLAGVVAGFFGLGGGIVFVPALVLLGLGQLEAEATSLLAILPTVVVGAWRHHRFGNVRWRAAAVVGAASVPGAFAGVVLARSLDETTLRRLFALLLLAVAVQLGWRHRR